MSCISRHAYLMGAKVNILITPSHRACLADFGVASCKDSTSLVTTFTPTAGTLRWQAPELRYASCIYSYIAQPHFRRFRKAFLSPSSIFSAIVRLGNHLLRPYLVILSFKNFD